VLNQQKLAHPHHRQSEQQVVTMLLGMLGILLSIWIAGWLIVRANIKQQKMGITHERNI